MTNDAADAPHFSKKVAHTRRVIITIAMPVVICLLGTLQAASGVDEIQPIAQASSAAIGEPTFDVASVEPTKSTEARKGSTRLQPGGRFVATNVTPRELIETAYRRHGFDRLETSGGPAWIDSERFDVVARAPGDHVVDSGGVPRTWRMLRTLLAERFKLSVHSESRERPIYALVMATSNGKTGPRLRKSDIDCAAAMEAELRGQRLGKGRHCGLAFYPHRLVATMTMPILASALSGLVDRIVVDHTGLTGNFDLELEAVEIRPSPIQGPSSRPSDTDESIFTALPEQLGLKLKPTKGSVEILVIDHAERPQPG